MCPRGVGADPDLPPRRWITRTLHPLERSAGIGDRLAARRRRYAHTAPRRRRPYPGPLGHRAVDASGTASGASGCLSAICSTFAAAASTSAIADRRQGRMRRVRTGRRRARHPRPQRAVPRPVGRRPPPRRRYRAEQHHRRRTVRRWPGAPCRCRRTPPAGRRATRAASRPDVGAAGEHRLRGSPAASATRRPGPVRPADPVTTTRWPPAAHSPGHLREPLRWPSPRRRLRARVHDGDPGWTGPAAGTRSARSAGSAAMPSRRSSRHQRVDLVLLVVHCGPGWPAAARKASSRSGSSGRSSAVLTAARGRAG